MIVIGISPFPSLFSKATSHGSQTQSVIPVRGLQKFQIHDCWATICDFKNHVHQYQTNRRSILILVLH